MLNWKPGVQKYTNASRQPNNWNLQSGGQDGKAVPQRWECRIYLRRRWRPHWWAAESSRRQNLFLPWKCQRFSWGQRSGALNTSNRKLDSLSCIHVFPCTVFHERLPGWPDVKGEDERDVCNHGCQKQGQPPNILSKSPQSKDVVVTCRPWSAGQLRVSVCRTIVPRLWQRRWRWHRLQGLSSDCLLMEIFLLSRSSSLPQTCAAPATQRRNLGEHQHNAHP